MKQILIIIIFSIISLQGEGVTWTEENRRNEREQVLLWEGKLAEARQKPPVTRLAELWLGLRNMGYRRTIDGHSPTVDEIYQGLQNELLTIPGHARYFADRMANARRSTKDFVTDQRYHESCETLRDILPHLPSPETVQVLGEMLENGADAPTTEQWVDFLKMKQKGGEFEWYYPSRLGGVGLLSLNIRQMPPGPDRYGMIPSYDEEGLLAWWQEVKTGKITFSFKDQKVEYRFKPDGTWDTIALVSPPDDGPKPPKAESVDRKRPAEFPALNGNSAISNSWAWIIGGTMALLAIVVWIGVKRR